MKRESPEDALHKFILLALFSYPCNPISSVTERKPVQSPKKQRPQQVFKRRAEPPKPEQKVNASEAKVAKGKVYCTVFKIKLPPICEVERTNYKIDVIPIQILLIFSFYEQSVFDCTP